MLGEANRLLEAGHIAEAAPLFAQLAQQAESQGMPRRAAELHLQAARSLMQIGNPQPALAHVHAALNLFTGLGLTGKAQAVYQRIVHDLRAADMHAEADQLERDFQAQSGLAQADTGEGFGSPAPQPRGRLPAKCPRCGGPVRSDEVEWIDEHSAACDYCGSVLQVL